ncbi:hypothetical protein BKA80DRAFT_3290 [Phyllosticta citrichinensis]
MITVSDTCIWLLAFQRSLPATTAFRFSRNNFKFSSDNSFSMKVMLVGHCGGFLCTWADPTGARFPHLAQWSSRCSKSSLRVALPVSFFRQCCNRSRRLIFYHDSSLSTALAALGPRSLSHDIPDVGR